MQTQAIIAQLWALGQQREQPLFRRWLLQPHRVHSQAAQSTFTELNND